MIIGIQILCDNCLKLGPQLADRFHVGLDEDGAPLITVICPACAEKHEVVFVGVSADARLRPNKTIKTP